MVAESLAKQEEEGILCSPTSQIENVNEEEMDTSISHHKRKVTAGALLQLMLRGLWCIDNVTVVNVDADLLY